MAGPADFEAWFRLLETPGLGRQHARRLLASFGSAEAVLSAPASSLRAIIPANAAMAVAAAAPATFAPRLHAAQAWLSGGPSRHVITLGDALYPARLLQAPDPPLMLFVHGDPAHLARPALAVVGSRFPTAQGRENALAFAAALSQQGLVVVSGLAQGIDAAAHEGALQGVAGTVAVLGGGPDQPYPAQNAALAWRIAEHGALLSEYAPGTPPLAENFPQRNRIIAGLALGTLVVEAALRSGSLITARLSAEAGREVFAVPGSIHSPQSKGCHALIKQGAKLVEVATDILEELRWPALRAESHMAPSAPSAPEATEADPRTDPLLAALGHDPVTLDALSARTGWPTQELAAKLMQLELEGRVARLPGGLYQRLSRA